MTDPGDTLSLSYAACRRMSRAAGSNFYASFLLLPRAQRQGMDALYAFFRHTDDLADSAQDVGLRVQALTRWRAEVEYGLRNGCEPGKTCENTNASSAILPALVHTAGLFHIPGQHLLAVLEGAEMDLHKRRYETFDELMHYCQRVASAVGLACIHVWGFRGPEAIEPARKAGVALQLTNILRDLREDLRQDRVYLPLADLHECGYSIDDLKQQAADERFQQLMRMQIDRAEGFYREGAALLPLLEPAGQRAYGMITEVYHALLKKIALRPGDVFSRRVQVNRIKKCWIAARWALLPPRVAHEI
jgi:15-cis-phytoene synthase